MMQIKNFQMSYIRAVAKKVKYCDYVRMIVMDRLKDLEKVMNTDGHSRKTVSERSIHYF